MALPLFSPSFMRFRCDWRRRAEADFAWTSASNVTTGVNAASISSSVGISATTTAAAAEPSWAHHVCFRISSIDHSRVSLK